MKKEGFRSTLLPLVIIPIGGMLALGLCYLLLSLTHSFVRHLSFSANPPSVPVFMVRGVLALVLLVFYWAFLRTKISDVAKATVLVGPLGFLTTTAILTFYDKPAWAIAVTVLIAAISTFLVFRSKKPWFYYYAIAITVLVSIAFALPRA